MDPFEAMNSVRRVERPGDGSRLLVVGCDGSPASRNALAYAVGLSRRERAHLVVVVVREPNGLIALAPWAVAAEHWAPTRSSSDGAEAGGGEVRRRRNFCAMRDAR